MFLTPLNKNTFTYRKLAYVLLYFFKVHFCFGKGLKQRSGKWFRLKLYFDPIVNDKIRYDKTRLIKCYEICIKRFDDR